MIYFLFTIPLVIYAYFGHRFIRKFEYVHYVLCLILAIIGGSIEGHNVLNQGFLGTSLFLIVMYTGVIAKSTLKQRLMRIRAQYAIMGFILISSHAITYLAYLLDEGMIFVHASIPLGLLAYLIFIPLFITSFVFIRKQIGYKYWKKLHQFGYIGYLALFIHLYFIANSRQEFYVTIFTVYGLFRLIAVFDRYFTKKQLKQQKEQIES